MCIFEYNSHCGFILLSVCYKNNDLISPSRLIPCRTPLQSEKYRYDIKVHEDRAGIQYRSDQRRRHDRRIEPDLLRRQRSTHPMHFAMMTTAIIVIPSASASMIFQSYIRQMRIPFTIASKVLRSAPRGSP